MSSEPSADAMLPQTATAVFPQAVTDTNGATAPSAPSATEDTGAGSFIIDDPHPNTQAAPVPSPSPASAPTPDAPPASADDLLNLKQSALQQLTPLIGHLEQTPEEKFRTTMMMIQAADNQNLLQSAYEAAQAIPDEKARAQALLDVVNEINYFTQQHHDAAA